jgi:hypothetical protein
VYQEHLLPSIVECLLCIHVFLLPRKRHKCCHVLWAQKRVRHDIYKRRPGHLCIVQENLLAPFLGRDTLRRILPSVELVLAHQHHLTTNEAKEKRRASEQHPP